jgi:hypothetical protein
VDESLRQQRDASLGLLEALIRRGRQLRDTRSVEATRAWQQECAAAVNQLAGGSKAHWLSRTYSRALLVRSPDGGAVLEADATEIVDRILLVLEQGAAALSSMDDAARAFPGPQRPRLFEFVHKEELRPVLEHAFDESRDAFERREFGLALILSCSIIEALLTDALEHVRAQAHDGAEGSFADWSFERRIAEAEREGIIRGGCARLPPAARTYRNLTDDHGQVRTDADVSEREARIAGQVLRVVMRDLDPGR